MCPCASSHGTPSALACSCFDARVWDAREGLFGSALPLPSLAPSVLLCVLLYGIALSDAHVGDSMFSAAVRGVLAPPGGRHACVLVTHQLQFLPQCDRVCAPSDALVFSTTLHALRRVVALAAATHPPLSHVVLCPCARFLAPMAKLLAPALHPSSCHVFRTHHGFGTPPRVFPRPIPHDRAFFCVRACVAWWWGGGGVVVVGGAGVLVVRW
jgi:hypothetical protein